MIDLDPTTLSRKELTALANGLVVPRPIAWISTVAADGTPNLAPFSYFNCFSTAPLTIGVGPGSREGLNKDSLANIKARGEFTLSVVTESLARRANLSSAEFDPSVDEWIVAGVTQQPSTTVAPPFVAESPAAFECRVFTIVDLGEADRPTNSLVVARVTAIHVSEDVVRDGLEIDADALAAVGRMGGDLWCTTRDRFSLRRPSIEEAHRGVDAIALEPHRGAVVEG